MRRLVAVASVTALAAATAVVAVTATTAGAARRAADQGFAGGGFVRIATLPGDKRARFDFAVRESQSTGVVRGKDLTYRVQGYDLQWYVVHGTSKDTCGVTTTPGAYNGGGSFSGHGTLSTYNPFTFAETLVDSDVRFMVNGTDNADPGAGFDLVGVELVDIDPLYAAAVPGITRDSTVDHGNIGVLVGPNFC